MGTFEIILVVIIVVVVLALAGTDKFQFSELDEIKRRLENIDEERAHMSLEVAWQRHSINDLTERIDKLEKRLADLEKQLDRVPIEEMDEEIKRMASWNDGWSEIVNFGKDIPKLNKEVLKHE